jgi:hypothetical protein
MSSKKKSNDRIGIRSRDLPACIIVPLRRHNGKTKRKICWIIKMKRRRMKVFARIDCTNKLTQQPKHFNKEREFVVSSNLNGYPGYWGVSRTCLHVVSCEIISVSGVHTTDVTCETLILNAPRIKSFQRAIHFSLCLLFSCAIAQVASRWLPTAAARVRARVWQVGFVVDKLALGQVFSEYYGFPCQSSFHEKIIITRGRYNRPFSGRRAEWAQYGPPPHYAN